MQIEIIFLSQDCVETYFMLAFMDSQNKLAISGKD